VAGRSEVAGAAWRHGANVLRALARNLEAAAGPAALEPPLDHASARDAVTLLGWRGESSSEVLQEALGLSQPACVRVVDRLATAGLVTRRRMPGERRLLVGLSEEGAAAAGRLSRQAREDVEGTLRAAVPPEEIEAFVVSLDRVAAVAFGAATDTVRFCRSCDVPACIGEGRACPSDVTCRANLAARDG